MPLDSLWVWQQGWAGRHIDKTLFGVCLLVSNFATLDSIRRWRQRDVPIGGDYSVAHAIGVVYLHIILTWASCVAYLD